MQPLPKTIEFRVVEVDQEIKGDHGEHIGWKRVPEIHRMVIKNDSGQRIVTGDTVIGDTPEEFREKNPGVPLIGAQHEVGVRDVRAFLEDATPEELADLGFEVPTDMSVTEVVGVTSVVDEEDDDDTQDSVRQYPVHRGGPYWTLSDGSTVQGKREDAEIAQRALDAEED